MERVFGAPDRSSRADAMTIRRVGRALMRGLRCWVGGQLGHVFGSPVDVAHSGRPTGRYVWIVYPPEVVAS
jgi:hypothetical protein